MKTVVIAGLGTVHPGSPIYRPGMEVWGINDCLQHLPEVRRFTKIFNIHKDFPRCIDDLKPGRFKNWRAKYEKSKALIITAKDLGLSKQRILDISELVKSNDYCFCSSISYAIFEAVEKGYKEIRLYRVSLGAKDCENQYPGIMSNIRWAQSQGVKVYWPWQRFIEKNYKGSGESATGYGEIDSVPVNTVSFDDMTVSDLKKAVKSKGLKIPYNATKKQLIDILK